MTCQPETSFQTEQARKMRAARVVFVQTLGLNLLVSAAKLTCGSATNLLSMTADGFHSLLDASSNIIGIIALSVAMKPADDGHPYGHRKFEALASIGIALLLFYAGFHIVGTAIDRCIFGGEPPKVYPISYLVMITTILINFAVSRYEKLKSKDLGSQILYADSEHTLTDIYVSFTVLAAVISVTFKLYWLDIAASVFVVAVIVRAAITIVSRNLGSLVDAAVVDYKAVQQLVLAVPGVLACHAIRSRGTADHMFIDLHIEVSPHLSVAEGHAIASAVERVLSEGIAGVAEVTVHVEDIANPTDNWRASDSQNNNDDDSKKTQGAKYD